MQWEILIIPLIALGVWIIGTLFKTDEDNSKKGVRSRGNPSSRTPARRPGADLDRFLEEARRRREAEERPKPKPAPPRVQGTRPPLRERPPRPRESPRVVVPAPVKEEILEAIPVAPPPAAPLAVVPVAGALRRSENLTPPSATPAAPRSAPVLQQARSMLSKPQTAATAFVLREIFDRPLCKRRR